ncbi:DUF362 domain-containing protein [Thermodesulfobacteriota bacterium]
MVKKEAKFGKRPEVALVINEKGLNYTDMPPFSPHERYPEYRFDHVQSKFNAVYDSVRKMFIKLEYDKENFGKQSWNPLKEFVSPGQKVVIKPNWVFHQTNLGLSFSGMITHSSIIRPILDYAIIALKGKGQIIIGDAPIQSADFSGILAKSEIESVVSFLRERSGIDIKIEDFRREITMIKDNLVVDRIFEHGSDFIAVNLRGKSFLSPISNDYRNFRVTNYDKDKMVKYHNERDHIYVIHQTILEADAVISLPKLKSHRKAGLTCCLKNSVGINCQKDCLPHHRKYSVEEGGDAYRKASFLKRIKEHLYEKFDKTHSLTAQQSYLFFIRVLNWLIKILSIENDFEGSWYGNDTVWRTILDINRILFFADSEGRVHEEPQRKLLYLVDGIVAGEREGPLEPTNRHLGLMAVGENPLDVDLAISRIIGVDYTKIPSLDQAVRTSFLWDSAKDVGDLSVCYNNNDIRLDEFDLNLHLEPSAGWKGHIELDTHR